MAVAKKKKKKKDGSFDKLIKKIDEKEKKNLKNFGKRKKK